MLATKTIKVHVKDKHVKLLSAQAAEEHFVWSHLNERSHRTISERGGFLSEYDLHPYTRGAGKELGLHSQSLQCIAKVHVTRRKQFTRYWPGVRPLVSGDLWGGYRSIPVRCGAMEVSPRIFSRADMSI